MKGILYLSAAFVLVILLALVAGSSTAQGPGPAGSASPDAQVGTVFTYQGELKKDGSPVNDTCTMVFRLYDADVAGDLVATPITMSVAIADGLFTAALDFGSVFRGDACWLEVAVQCPGDADFNILDPRQELTAAPYALSLRPGAHVEGDTGNGLVVINTRAVGYAVGVYGRTDAPGATDPLLLPSSGLRGTATSHTGPAYGVYAASASAQGKGVYGLAYSSTGATFGVYGEATSIAGVGVYGRSDHTGVQGEPAFDGIGVYGLAESTACATALCMGVKGESSEGYGVYGETSSAAGVGGHAMGSSGVNYGVFGRTMSPDGWAGYFMSNSGNGVYVTTPAGKTGLNVAGGSKNAVVATADGARLLYSEESTEVWFSDYGFGRLQNGAATIAIDPIFAQTVNLDEPYHVYLTAEGEEFVVLLVAAKSHTHFVVRGVTLDGTPANCTFDYRIVAMRRGFEGQRLERAPWADNDANLNPESATAVPGGER